MCVWRDGRNRWGFFLFCFVFKEAFTGRIHSCVFRPPQLGRPWASDIQRAVFQFSVTVLKRGLLAGPCYLWMLGFGGGGGRWPTRLARFSFAVQSAVLCLSTACKRDAVLGGAWSVGHSGAMCGVWWTPSLRPKHGVTQTVLHSSQFTVPTPLNWYTQEYLCNRPSFVHVFICVFFP